MPTPNNLLQQLKAFSDVLDAEAIAIKARDVDALETLVRQKQQIAEQLDGADGLLGLGAGGAEAAAAAGFSAEEQQALKALLTHCQQQNQINGAMLDAGMKINRSLLDIFTGRSRSNLTYGRAGRMSDDGPSAHLTQV